MLAPSASAFFRLLNQVRSAWPKWAWHLLVGGTILAVAGFDIRYLAVDCPWQLSPDEAHYWEWSRRLDWSYYSKGPLVAWLIHASWWLLGSWAESIGQPAAAVRIPAVVCGSLMLVAMYVLALRHTRRSPAAALLVLGLLTAPAVMIGRLVFTIDAPFTCCWSWALLFGHLAVLGNKRWAWPALGATIAFGILAKYTMVLFVPCLFLFLLADRQLRSLLWQPGPWIAIAIAALGGIPILWWNYVHNWVSVRHVGGQAAAGDIGVRWLSPANYFFGQAAMLLGFWFLCWLLAAIAFRPSRCADASRRWLWWTSVPIVAFFGIFSLRTNVMLNWPVVAYLSGMILALDWLQARRNLAWKMASLAFAIGGLLINMSLRDMRPLYPLLDRVVAAPTALDPLPHHRFDPTCRLRGWTTLAARVDSLRQQLREEGIEPVVTASRWNLASELGFYCHGHPTTYALGSALWDRRSQFDLWHPNPIADPSQFHGRTFIYVDLGRPAPELLAAFDHVESLPRYWYREGGRPIACWDISICRGFRGFPEKPGNLEQRY